MSDWELVDNPDWTDLRPRKLDPACHDGSPFITIHCNACGDDMHLHETQVKNVPANQGIAAACKGCGRPLVFQAGFLPDAFAELRRRGWEM